MCASNEQRTDLVGRRLMKWCQESDGYLLKLHVEKFTEFKKVCLLVETNRLPAENTVNNISSVDQSSSIYCY